MRCCLGYYNALIIQAWFLDGKKLAMAKMVLLASRPRADLTNKQNFFLASLHEQRDALKGKT